MAIKQITATINGTDYVLTYDSTTDSYKKTITAPAKSSYSQSGNYYNVKVKAEDTAGNTISVDSTDSSFGSKLKLYVKETTAPVISIVSPTANQMTSSNKLGIVFNVTDNDSGVKESSVVLKIDGTAIASGIVKTAISNGFQYTYTPTTALIDGTHTITVNASDNDGNSAAQKQVTFVVDTVPPQLSVTSPANGLVTNKTTVTVSGSTNDTTTSIASVTINGVVITVSSNGSFSKTLTLSEGSNVITVIATDTVGKYTTIVRTVVLDTKAPTINSIDITPNQLDIGSTYVISVKIGD